MSERSEEQERSEMERVMGRPGMIHWMSRVAHRGAQVLRAQQALMEQYNICGDDTGCMCEDAEIAARNMAVTALDAALGKLPDPPKTPADG